MNVLEHDNRRLSLPKLVPQRGEHRLRRVSPLDDVREGLICLERYVEERPEGPRGEEPVTGAPEQDRFGLVKRAELPDQRGLPDSRFAGDEREPAHPFARLGERVV